MTAWSTHDSPTPLALPPRTGDPSIKRGRPPSSPAAPVGPLPTGSPRSSTATAGARGTCAGNLRIAASLLLACGGTAPVPTPAPAPVADSCRPGGAGNPIVDGWYADPDIRVYDGVYWVYPTYSAPYDQQTFLDAFSSPDLIHWTKHARVLDTSGVRWATRAMWAPSPVFRNGTYFLYFGANDIQTDGQLGGIGVATATAPQGPYRDALGQPLIGRFANGAQPIDQNVFIDDDGQAYLYYGGWGHCNVAKLNADMTNLGTFTDGATLREITPPGYVEGAYMFKRHGTYYLMWSEGGWTGPDYRVSYARAHSPTGPFATQGTILSQHAAIATGSGHNSVVNRPGTDDWYIFYHRHPLGDSNGNHRVLAYERMVFADDGTIAPVELTAADDFCDGNALGWTPRGGSWRVTDGSYLAAADPEAKTVLNTNHRALSYEADVRVEAAGDAGLLFRAADIADGVNRYRGYYAVIDTARGRVTLGKADGSRAQPLASAPAAVAPRTPHRLRVVASGDHLEVYLDGAATPAISADDATYAGGTTGLISHGAGASFDNVRIVDPTGDVAPRPAGGAGR